MGKPIDEQTDTELEATSRSLRALGWTVGSFCALYAAILLYWLLTGAWDSTKTLGTIPLLGAVGGALVPTLARLRAVRREIARRSGG